MNKGKTGVNTNTIIHIHRKPRKCNCRKCAYYHNGEEGKEYCSMNRKRLFPRKCSNYNKKINGMVLYKKKKKKHGGKKKNKINNKKG